MSKPLISSDVAGGYIPTTEDKQKAKLMPDKFLLSGDGVFHTIQGEGNWAGLPTTFVRLHVCNLKCSRCDAWYTWRADTEEYYKEPKSIDKTELLERVYDAQKEKGISDSQLVANITFTGGEPLLHMQQIEWFMKNYPNIVVQIETNGTIPPTDYILSNAKFNCSPKIDNSGNPYKLRFRENVLKKLAEANAIFKFVFQKPEDIDEVLQAYSFLPKEKIWFMPEGVTKEQNAEVFERCIDKLLSAGVNVTCRGQNVMRDGAKRGV